MRIFPFLSLFVILSWYSVQVANCQSKEQILQTNRLPIAQWQIQQASIELNRLQIKIIPDFAILLPDDTLLSQEPLFVATGISALDEVNANVKAKAYFPLFGPLKNIAGSENFRERHIAHGLHLWFTIELESGVDVLEAVALFAQIDMIELAEPIFRKSFSYDYAQNKLIESEKNINSKTFPNDPSFSTQWHYHNTGQSGGTISADIDLLNAWDIEKGHPDIIIAVIDDGIQYNHPDLVGNMWQNTAGHFGYNFVSNTPAILPGNHGTHVAGTISAETNNGIGVAGVAGGSGANDGVRLMSCQVFEVINDTSNGFDIAPIYAADNGAAISQNSWGYSDPYVYNSSILDAIDYFNTHGGGDIISDGGISIFSAGNSNSNEPFYPAAYSGSFSVAATGFDDTKASYSNFASFHSWIDISAPGGDFNNGGLGVYSTLTNNNYGSYQGTSMAAPHVSGVAALILSHLHRNQKTISIMELKCLLTQSVDNHYPTNPDYPGKLGSGRLNAANSLSITQNFINNILDPANLSVQQISHNYIELSWVQNQSSLDVMLVFSEDSLMGRPIEGVSYSEGDSLPDGGEVVYIGSNLSHTQLNLMPGTSYFFRAFSLNSNYQYSIGVNRSATTNCISVTDLPYSEVFESTKLPNCWSKDKIGGLGWFFYGYTYSQKDIDEENCNLYSPVFDFSEYSAAILNFSHYLSVTVASSPLASFQISLNGGQDWELIQTWNSNFSNYQTYAQTMLNLGGESNVQFKWHYESGGSEGYWVIDEFNIAGTPINYWTGTASTDWLNGANWSELVIPTSSMDVIIPDVSSSSNQFPIIETNFTADCKRLIVRPAATLTIKSDGSLITYGSVDNMGDIQIERSFTFGNWHFVSPPTNDATALTFDGSYLIAWEESTMDWIGITDIETLLIPAKGYGLFSNNHNSLTFSGTPNFGEVSIPISNNNPGNYGGYNLVGNPFPSSIDWSLLDDTFGAVYYWNGSTYLSWIDGNGAGSPYVPPMQGIFLRTQSNTNFEVNINHRTHQTIAFFKDKDDRTKLTLKTSYNEIEDRTFIIFDDNACESFEIEKDAFKMMSWTEGVSQIYSLNTDKERFSVDIRPICEAIPIGFFNSNPGIYQIEIETMKGLTSVVLEDKELNVYCDLNNNKYLFYGNPVMESDNRFLIHLNRTDLIDTQNSNSYIHVFRNELIVKTQQKSWLKLYDISGKEVFSKQVNADELNVFKLKLHTGIYLLSVKNSLENISRRVLFQNF